MLSLPWWLVVQLGAQWPAVCMAAFTALGSGSAGTEVTPHLACASGHPTSSSLWPRCVGWGPQIAGGSAQRNGAVSWRLAASEAELGHECGLRVWHVWFGHVRSLAWASESAGLRGRVWEPQGTGAGGKVPPVAGRGLCCSQLPTPFTLPWDRALGRLPRHPHITDGETEAEGGTVTGQVTASNVAGVVQL